MEENDEHFYFSIIRIDGSFIIRSADDDRDNCFERVRAFYEDVNGMSAEEYLTRLQAAMTKNEEYSTELTIHGERRHMFCTRLSRSEWYLLDFMPCGAMGVIVGMAAIATANIGNSRQVQNCPRKITLSSKHLLG